MSVTHTANARIDSAILHTLYASYDELCQRIIKNISRGGPTSPHNTMLHIALRCYMNTNSDLLIPIPIDWESNITNAHSLERQHCQACTLHENSDPANIA